MELVLTQPTGVVEIHVGSVTETDGPLVVDLRTERVEGTRTAKPITEVRRRLEVSGDKLVSEMWMAAMGAAAHASSASGTDPRRRPPRRLGLNSPGSIMSLPAPLSAGSAQSGR